MNYIFLFKMLLVFVFIRKKLLFFHLNLEWIRKCFSWLDSYILTFNILWLCMWLRQRFRFLELLTWGLQLNLLKNIDERWYYGSTTFFVIINSLISMLPILTLNNKNNEILNESNVIKISFYNNNNLIGNICCWYYSF